MKKAVKLLTAVIYGIGTVLTAALGILFLSHSQIVLFPNAMLPMRLYEQAFSWLALGAIPMLAACWAVCRSFHFHGKAAVLVFLPGILCACCTVYIIGLLIVGMIHSFSLA